MLHDTYIDLAISEGDIAVQNGQLVIQKDESLIQEALLRRVTTPTNIYTIYTVDMNNSQLIRIDEDYGNISYELTASDSKLVLETLRDNLKASISRETRVTIKSIEFTEDMLEGVSTVITYTIDNESDLSQRLVIL
jgi:hypothetical protein